MEPPADRRLAGGRRLAVLLLPWLYLVLFALLYAVFVWPRAGGGHLLGILLAGVAGEVFLVFAAAAVTFTRDVLTGRYP
jgi:hypothetical protein